jgi:hypothetical protein
VTPVARKPNNQVTDISTLPASASPPNAAVLIRPTIAVSTKMYRGSAISVKNTGTARRKSRRSVESRNGVERKLMIDLTG